MIFVTLIDWILGTDFNSDWFLVIFVKNQFNWEKCTKIEKNEETLKIICFQTKCKEFINFLSWLYVVNQKTNLVKH